MCFAPHGTQHVARGHLQQVLRGAEGRPELQVRGWVREELWCASARRQYLGGNVRGTQNRICRSHNQGFETNKPTTHSRKEKAPRAQAALLTF